MHYPISSHRDIKPPTNPPANIPPNFLSTKLILLFYNNTLHLLLANLWLIANKLAKLPA